MHGSAIAAIALTLCLLPTNAFGFSSFWNVDGWTRERLHKAGLSVSEGMLISHDGESTKSDMVITFDCSRLPKERKVSLTARLTSQEREVAIVRVSRSRLGEASVSLELAIRRDCLERSSVTIHIHDPEQPAHNGFLGYTLSMKRLVELAGTDGVNQ